MKVHATTIALGALGLSLMYAFPAAASGGAAQAVISKFAARWNETKTYQCTVTSHEVAGAAVQDRVYHFYFSKPFNTRAEIVSGDGRGSVGVWRGGDKVRGHRGGMLRSIILNVGLHSRLATTLRGTTFLDSNFGTLLARLKGFPTRLIDASSEGKTTVITATESSALAGVTKEKYYFGSFGLPARYEQYMGNTLVKRVTYTDMKLNPHLPPSTFDL